MQALILGVGLLALGAFAEVIIVRATRLARFLRVSELSIGFILVSLATTLPELVVSLMASLSGHTGIVLGNVFGSNVANLALILGLNAAFAGVLVARRETKNLLRALFLLTAIPLVLFIGNFGRLTGALLVLSYCGFVFFALRKKIPADGSGQGSSWQAVTDALLLFVAGLALVVSAKFVLDAAVFFSSQFGITNAFIGATVIALGTSLPELVVSFKAVSKGKDGIALGNLLGASITNVTLNLGVATLINAQSANIAIVAELVAFSLLANLALWYFLRTKGSFGRREGLILLAIYFVYLFSLVLFETKP